MFWSSRAKVMCVVGMIELENLNSATDEINKLEIELEEANSTFRILLNESTRRLKLSSKKLGNCIDKARPYYEALEKAREAQIECQKAAVKFQRANEIHTAAKETVALAEQRFMSNSHEWQFDNAWQEMLNHATQKVMDAEKQKAECHTEHQRRTKIFHAAEQKVQQLEERFRRSIAKSRPYFEEKQICQDQLQTQKNRIQELQAQVQAAKSTYSTALRNLERISDDIHRQRGDYPQLMGGGPPPGPREPGVGAELNSPITTSLPPLPDFELELEKCDYPSIAGSQISLSGCSHRSSDFSYIGSSTAAGATTTSPPSLATMDDCEVDEYCESNNYNAIDNADNTTSGGGGGGVNLINDIVDDESDLEALRQKMKMLAVRPIEGGDGQQEQNDMWEHELKATVDKLDHLMLLKECACKNQQQQQQQQQNHKKYQKSHQHHNIQRPDSLGAESTKVTAAHSGNDDDHDNDDNDVIILTPIIASAKKNPTIKVTLSSTNINTAATTTTTTIITNNSLPVSPEHSVINTPIKQLNKLEPLPSVNVSMRELPLLQRLSNEILDHHTSITCNKQRRLSLD